MHSLPRSFIIACACAATSGLVHAQWTGTSSGLSYADTANWQDGVINGVFSNNLTVSQTVYLPNNYTTPASGLQFSHGDAFGMTLLPESITAYNWNLAGNISVDIGGTSSQGITLGSDSRRLNLDLGGATRSLSVNSGLASNSTAGRDTLTIWGDVSNGSLTKTGGGTVSFNAALSLAGDYVHESGHTTLERTASMLSASRVIVSGTMSRFVLNGWASDRIGDDTALHLNGGIFGMQATGTETLGTVHLDGARAAIGAVGGSSSTLVLSAIDRDEYSTLSLVGTSTNPIGSGVNAVRVTNDADILVALKGGGGADGSTTVSIVPWATAADAVSNSLTGSVDTHYYAPGRGLVTYTSGGGFRALNKTTEYADTLAGSSNVHDNVRLTTAETLGASKTINALYVDSGITTNLGGNTLTLGSGVLATGNYTTSFSNGTINFGTNRGYVMTGRATTYISAKLSGSNGVVFAATPGQTIHLSGANDYTGRTVINSGTLNLSTHNTLPTGTAVRVDRSAKLYVSNNINQQIVGLAGGGTAELGGSNARLDIGTSIANSTAGVFTVGDGGVVSPGDDSGYYQASTLTFANGSVRFESGSVLDIDIASLTSFDSINLSTAGKTVTADLGSTLSLTFLDGFSPEVGDTFQLISVAGAAVADSVVNAGNFNIVGGGYIYDLNSAGLLTVVSAIPEPSTYAALFGGAALALVSLRRRRGN